MKTKYCYLWSYDNFQIEYEESEKDYETIQDAIKAMWEDRKTNLDLMKSELKEPKIYYMIRKKEEDDDTIWITDYTWTRRKNKIFLHRKDII